MLFLLFVESLQVASDWRMKVCQSRKSPLLVAADTIRQVSAEGYSLSITRLLRLGASEVIKRCGSLCCRANRLVSRSIAMQADVVFSRHSVMQTQSREYS
jgi:hypothetical protein